MKLPGLVVAAEAGRMLLVWALNPASAVTATEVMVMAFTFVCWLLGLGAEVRETLETGLQD